MTGKRAAAWADVTDGWDAAPKEHAHHRADCHRCWTDFAYEWPTNHACDCDACVPLAPQEGDSE